MSCNGGGCVSKTSAVCSLADAYSLCELACVTTSWDFARVRTSGTYGSRFFLLVESSICKITFLRASELEFDVK